MTTYQSNQKKTDHLYKFLSGAVAGVASRTAVAPIERVIIIKQTQIEQYKGFNSYMTLFRMYQNEGIRSWFKGNLANSVRIAPFQAIEFYMFDAYKNFYNLYLKNSLELNRVILDLITGGLAGITATALVYPLDLAKTHLAINIQKGNSLGITKTLTTIFKNEGFKAMYKGLSATMIGMTPYASLKLTFFNQLQFAYSKYINIDQRKMSCTSNLIIGGLSGCLAVTITYPTDLIRRNLQILKMNSNQTMTYKGVIKNIFQKDGLLGFYRGLPATYLKLLPSTALLFAINDFLKQASLKF